MSIGLGLWVCLAALTGTAVGVTAGNNNLVAAAAGLSIGVGAIALVRRDRPLVLIAITCLAATHGAHTRSHVLRPPASSLLSGDPVTRVGVLQSDAAMTPAGVRVDLLIEGRRVRATVTGTLASHEYPAWRRGRTFLAPMRLRAPDVVRNPGSPSVTWQVLTRRFDLVGTVKSAALVEVRPGAWWQEAAGRVRAHVRHTSAAWLTPYAPSTHAVVTAILIGDRAGLDDAVTRRLQAAGIYHVIAISGGNVAMLTVGCFLLLRLVSRTSVLPILITIGVVAIYGMVVGGEPSVLRAVVAAILYLVLRLAGLPPRPINLLAVVAAMCVAWDPLTVIDVGAWLSFGATFGLIVILPRLMAAARGDRARAPRDVVIAACLATVAAEIVILPITAGVFARVGVAGLVLNLIAIPAMVVVQFAGLALCVLAPVWPAAAAAAAGLAHLATVALLGSSAALDLAPWLSWRVPATSIWWTVAYYGAVGLALLCTRPRRRRTAVVAATLLIGIIAWSPFVALRRPAPGWLRVSVLDVGQGDAILVQTPGRRAFLVDAGGSPGGTFDVGGRIVTPAVWALGERDLEWLVLSHGDLDHVGGARRVIDDLRPREIWEGIPVGADTALQELRAVAQTRRIPWRRVQAGHELDIGAVQIRVRHPQRPDWQRVRVRNDDSIVLEVRYGDVAFLLTGDAGAEFESAPISRDPSAGSPRIRILKVGHHGSRSSTGDPLLDGFDPRIALVSVGGSNLFGHPAPSVVARLGTRGIHLFRTDRHGAIIVETDGRVVRAGAMSGKVLDVS